MLEPVVVGHVQGAFAVRGWLRVHSYTRPRGNIGRFTHWWLQTAGEWRAFRLRDFKTHGNAFLARLEGIDDRDTVVALVGQDIAVSRADLSPPAPGEYYWADLIGLTVHSRQGRNLGNVASMIETGSNDVLVVRDGAETLIPFVPEVYVLEVNLENGTILVDWPED